ncbi:S41 family peptidase [Myxococcus fulvus]|uniref:S41 family peptidase n=1 Tax=Myxococcus fulvus TaxID=33 RepID=UPI003B98E593
MTHALLRRIALCSLSLLCLTGGAPPAAAPADTAEALRAERRVRLVKLWGEVRFRHPWAFSLPAEWDAAFLAALPKVEAARDAREYAAAVQGMLAVLGDSATLVEPQTPVTRKEPAPALRPLKSWEKDVLVLDLRNLLGPDAFATFRELSATLDADAARARAVVLDLRMRGLERYGASWVWPRLLPHFIEGELRVPGLREVAHAGLRAQDDTDGTYRTELVASASELLTGTPGRKPARLVVLVDEDSVLDVALLALRAQGRVLLVAEGPLSIASLNHQLPVPLGEGFQALVSMDEPVLPLEADVKRPARATTTGPDEGMRQALALANRPPKASAAAQVARPVPAWRAEPAYPDALHPSRELRLLAGAKLWNVVRYFFPYHPLLSRPWEERLPGLLERLEAAKDAQAYALTLAEAATWLEDGHAQMRGHPELERFFGAALPIWLTDLDGKAVVLEVFVPEAVPGLAVGDVIETFNGEPFEARARRFAPYVAASTPQMLRDFRLRRAASAPDGTVSTLGVRGPRGLREVKGTHRRGIPPQAQVGSPWRMLEGNIGFVDLGLLEEQQVPAMFEALKDTRGIVFDLRDYPRGTMWALGPYLDVKGSRPYAVYECPWVRGLRSSHLKSSDAVPARPGPKYRGRTVTLIDARAISQAEHTGLLLEATTDTVFVGSPTTGTDGDVTRALLPGGVVFYFTGQAVLHGDGRQLQKKGLEPHVKVRPTLAGLQAGRDELLERALQVLREEPAPKAAVRQE